METVTAPLGLTELTSKASCLELLCGLGSELDQEFQRNLQVSQGGGGFTKIRSSVPSPALSNPDPGSDLDTDPLLSAGSFSQLHVSNKQ